MASRVGWSRAKAVTGTCVLALACAVGSSAHPAGAAGASAPVHGASLVPLQAPSPSR